MKKKIKSVHGKDNSDNASFIGVRKESGKILVFSSEGCGEIVLTTKQARQLMCILENIIKE